MAPGHKHQPVVQRNRRQIRKNRCTIFLAVAKFSMLLKNKQLSRLGCESDYQRLPLRELKTVYDDSHSNTLGREAWINMSTLHTMTVYYWLMTGIARIWKCFTALQWRLRPRRGCTSGTWGRPWQYQHCLGSPVQNETIRSHVPLRG
jgi:hypothetical protein